MTPKVEENKELSEWFRDWAGVIRQKLDSVERAIRENNISTDDARTFLRTHLSSHKAAGRVRQACRMRSTHFDDRSAYEEELQKDWQDDTTPDDACGRRQFTRLNSRLSPRPKLMPLPTEALALLRVVREAGKSSNLSGRKTRGRSQHETSFS